MSPHACPDRQQYEQLIVGVYPPDDELARLAEHLEGCSRCADAVGSLPGSDTFVAGWLVQIAAATALGALFGVLYTASGLRRESAATWSTIYGLAWWIGGWFAVMPPPLRFAPWAAVKDPALFQLAVAGLLACLGFGAALAGAFSVFGRAGDSTRDARVRAGHAVAPRPTAR